ncbi:hypothetical protein PIB30_017027 [Stylosanthes scabra]|uniref:Uncharacterized protein n=1 Tax=Stylosanthes scabra TaxID=79078 RepID=A0ABU6R7S8_9FABA|nr:hypothetical protein [Stylosanthes scabra]
MDIDAEEDFQRYIEELGRAPKPSPLRSRQAAVPDEPLEAADRQSASRDGSSYDLPGESTTVRYLESGLVVTGPEYPTFPGLFLGAYKSDGRLAFGRSASRVGLGRGWSPCLVIGPRGSNIQNSCPELRRLGVSEPLAVFALLALFLSGAPPISEGFSSSYLLQVSSNLQGNSISLSFSSPFVFVGGGVVVFGRAFSSDGEKINSWP